MKANKIIATAAVVLSFYAAASSPAESMQYTDDNWHVVSPTFYLWLFGVEGDISAKGNTRDVDLSIADVTEDLDGSLQIYIEVDKGNWGASIEPTYLAFQTEDNIAGTKFKADVNIFMLDGALSYRFWQTQNPHPMSLYALAGVRYWNYEIDVHNKGVPPSHSEVHLDIIDPTVGARFRMDVTEKVHLGVRSDVGGFGITDKQSHFTWEAWGLVSYDATKRFALFGGWRALGLNYDQNSGNQDKGVDVVFSGPVLGFNFDIFGWLADRKK